MTQFIYIYDALSREATSRELPKGSTPNEYLTNMQIKEFKTPTICFLLKKNELPLFLGRSEWDDPVSDEYVCYFVAYPQAITTTTLAVIAIISAVISIGLTIYSISQQPNIPDSQQQKQSPTYGLGNLQNSARLGQPIPVQYGTVRSFPDVASPYYTTIDTNDEFLFGRLCVGHGDFDITKETDIKIDDTPLDSFEDVTINVLTPNVAPTLYTYDVQTAKDISNIVLDDTAEKGPFVVNNSGTSINKIQVDFEFRRGLYVADNDGNLTNQSRQVTIWAQRIDNEGLALTPWLTVLDTTTTMIGASYDKLRFSFDLTIGAGNLDVAGRYQIKLNATVLPDTDPKIQDEVTLVRIKGYDAVAIPTSTNKTFIEFKIRANEQLNSNNSSILNVTAGRKINYYDNGVLKYGVSSSPIWAFYDLLTNDVYGAGWALARINLPHLFDLDNVIKATPDLGEPVIECNTRFDTSASAMDLAAQLAATARCQVYQRGGQIWLARDEYKSAISGFFTPDNSELDVEVTWKPRSVLSPNYFEVTYFDELTNSTETVNAVWPGETPLIKEEVEIKTVTNRINAWKEGRFFLAQDRLRRKTINFTTDIEGYIPNYLDKIVLSSPLLTTHTSGYLVRETDGVIELSEPVDFGDYAIGQFIVKRKDGTAYGPFPAVKGSTAYLIKPIGMNVADADLNYSINCPDSEASFFSFGLTSPALYCIVTNIAPSDDNKVNISCVVDDARVYTLDKNIGAVPDYGEDVVSEDPFIFNALEGELDFATGIITLDWDGQIYDKYVINFIYNVGGTLTTYTVTEDTAVVLHNTLVHPTDITGAVPVQVTITPILIINGIDVELNELTKNFPLTLVNC